MLAAVFTAHAVGDKTRLSATSFGPARQELGFAASPWGDIRGEISGGRSEWLDELYIRYSQQAVLDHDSANNNAVISNINWFGFNGARSRWV